MDTIGFYDRDPQGYSDRTFHADMSHARNRFTSLLPHGARILDLGCGSGRDTREFASEGFDVTPVDGSEGMCHVSRKNTGIETRHMLFSELDYESCFDGVWACSSLLHVPSSELPSILSKVHDALVPHGIFYMTFKKGSFEGERDGRHYTDMTGDSLVRLIGSTGFETIDIWESLEPGRDVVWVNALVKRS